VPSAFVVLALKMLGKDAQVVGFQIVRGAPKREWNTPGVGGWTASTEGVAARVVITASAGTRASQGRLWRRLR
jgi:hypothetical protein